MNMFNFNNTTSPDPIFELYVDEKKEVLNSNEKSKYFLKISVTVNFG